MDDLLDRYDFGQQLLQKSQERFNRRKHSRGSSSTSTSDESKMKSKEKATRSDSDDDNDRAKRSKLNHDRNKEQLKCSPNAPNAIAATSNPKRPPQKTADEEEKAKLRACFSSSDSDDDDPVAAIKRRQIAERRMKGWKIPEKRADIESTGPKHLTKMNDVSVTDLPEENVDTATEQSPIASFKQPSEESTLPPSPMLETKMTTAEKYVSKGEDVDKGNDAEMMEDAIPTPKSSPTKSEKESPMKRTDVMKTDEDKCSNEEMVVKYLAAKNASPPVKQTAAMRKVDIDKDNEPVSLTIVSWNISSAESSRVAPDPSSRSREAPRLICEEILRSEPDIIALQETAYQSFGMEIFASSGYVSIGSQTALHTNEYVDLLVKRELANGARRISLQSFQMNELPAVAGIIALKNGTRIAIASLHLPHTKEAAPFRKVLCGAIMEQLTSQNCDGIILTGDFNMRGFEDKTTENLCGGSWKDAWKEATNTKTAKETKFTWNSRVNMYHGPENFQWTCRLDRCYVKSEKGTLKHFDLIGNQPVDGNGGDYLSDHYGIVVKCDFASSDSPLVNDAVSSVGDTISLFNTASNPLKGGSNAAALRAARLQRFENAASSGTKKPTTRDTKQKEVIEIDLDGDCVTSNSLESDRALAERLHREEEMSAHRTFAENASQVDYSSVRPGVFDTMRNKRAYLQDGNDQSHSGWGMLQQLVDQGSVSGQPFAQGGVPPFRDSHEQAWSSGGWVWVKNPQYAKDPKARVDKECNVAKMSSEWKRLVESNVKITHRHLIDLATKHNVLDGKWLLYVKAEDIEKDWPKIRNAIIEGKLGSTAKISDTPDERGSHVVCIYCPNFLDKDDLLRVRRSISNDVGMYKTSVLRFKLDAVTYLNLYAKNQWKLKTTSYECGGKKDEECSTLISSWEKCTCATSDCCMRCYKPKEDSDKKDVHSQTAAMMKVDDDEDNEPVSLTIVSWNINEAKCSNVAPDPALRTREAPRLIREEILRSQPDVIALQESPNPLFGTENVAGTAQSHSGHVDLLVKRELAIDAKQISLQHIPAVAATFTLQNRTRIAIASLHLAPSKELAAERIHECESIMKKLTSRAQDVILAGDFNMRQSEDKTTEKLCGGNWVDAWKEATSSNPNKKFTWNTAENKYFDNPPRTIRFDRCYGRGDYLSDHYGIVAKYEVESSDSPLVNDATSSDDVTSALYNTTSASGSKDGSDAAALRAARLHKYENAGSFGATVPKKRHTKQKEEVIELLDSDDEDVNNCATSNSLESDRALAERLQREEEMNGHHSFAESSASQVDYSSVRPGVLGSLRDKHAALQPDVTAQLSASRNGVFATHIRAGVLSDTHPQAWSSGGWVWVKNPQYANDSKSRVDSKDDVARMSTEWNSLKKSNVKITHRHLIDLATKHNVLHGKWLLNIKADCVQTDWPKVRNAIVGGKLGLVAKISDAPDKRGHVVCIYCPNFLDKDEVLRIRKAIRNDVGLERHSILRFKLDAVTNANIYAYNSALRTTSYDCGGKDDEECSTFISHWEQCTMSEGCKRCYPCCLGRKPKNEDMFSITGLKYAKATAAQGEKVTLLREPENKHDPNAVKVVNGSGQLIGHIVKDKAAILSPRIKEMQEDLQSQNLKKLVVEGTIISVSDGYQQSFKVEFKEISNETCDAEVAKAEDEVVNLE
ncbi:5'-tyrosyl DNA phosphodiesterase [Skeletonema marinoi]|uniref:5'-tyrosyl DNA phosphodiesterase n=1 Tax=Skeletonema marinoi TaxID=267567 RepID=A0AAD9DG10_9STRA|nr:5'-tyrosyl DNA phosphodiesterase [Skeletonema marinoi]